MRVERIGIIYSDPARLLEIKGWLNPYTSLCHVVAFSGLPEAVPLLSKFPCDLLIVADRFPEAQGLSLLKGLRLLCRGAQVLMLATGIPNDDLTSVARSDLDVAYFHQPWDVQSLLAHIEAGIGKETPTFTTALALENDQYQRISQELERLLGNTSASSIYLVTEFGQVLDYKGSELTSIGEVSSLLGASFAALQELGATLGERGPAANLIQRQGAEQEFYALSVGQQALLVLRFSRGPNAPRIGTVAFYARQAATELTKILGEHHLSHTRPFMNGEMQNALSTELETLFSVPAEHRTAADSMNFDQAVKAGLISKSLNRHFDANEKEANHREHA